MGAAKMDPGEPEGGGREGIEERVAGQCEKERRLD